MTAEWTPEAIAAEEARRAELVASGICPDSGMTIRRCIGSDICDCFDHPEIRAALDSEDACPHLSYIMRCDICGHEKFVDWNVRGKR